MRFLLIVILLSFIVNLHAQSNKTPEKWLEINNLFFKNKDVFETRNLIPDDTSILIYDELGDHQLSFGFSFRKMNKKSGYQQLDLLGLNWTKSKDHTQVNNVNHGLIESIRGQEIKAFSALMGYQRGKLFPIASKLNGDIGARGFAWYKRSHNIPLNHAGYPVTVKSIGLGLNLELGLNYQIHKRINIGYNFAPIAIKGFWNDYFVDNPILPLREKTERGVEFDTEFLESAFDLRNFSIRYVF